MKVFSKKPSRSEMRTTWTSKWKAGQKSPYFSALLHDGSAITSKDLSGKKFILFFYNHDGSETCTNEACNVRDHFSELSSIGYLVFGVSEDSPRKHQKFIAKYDLPYPLISDPEHHVAKAFDVYGRKEFMGRISDAVHRTTFVINEDGIIEAIIHPVQSSSHSQQILETLNNVQ